MNWNVLRTSACLTFICLCVGCSSSQYPPVSGKVTYDGKPLANVRLVFNPVGDGATLAPFSMAITDETGAFSLETRDGNPGAVVGLHKVGFDWSDIRSYTMRDLEDTLRESRGNPEKVAKIEAKIADVKQKLASRPTLKAGLQTEFTVPDGGTKEAIFELINISQ